MQLMTGRSIHRLTRFARRTGGSRRPAARVGRDPFRMAPLGQAGLLGLLLVLAGLVAGARPALAQQAVTVQLAAVADSGVTGTATLTGEGDATTVSLDVSGLAAGASAQAYLHAGTCEAPSASFASLPALTADGAGKATATGPVQFNATENVALSDIADGEHIIAVTVGDETVACGIIPSAAAGASTPQVLPATGGSTPAMLARLLAAAGLLALGGGLLLRRLR